MTEDWRLFIDLATLPQKAGCQPGDLSGIVLKELVDNGLDVGAEVTLDCVDGVWIITDDGPGLDPLDVPTLFRVNRPLISSKLKRLPLRGMLGNGLRVVVGAVAAAGGTLVVDTGGHRLALAVDLQTGLTKVLSDIAIPILPGLSVRLSFGPVDPADAALAHATILISKLGDGYSGPSSPWWYGLKDFVKLFAQAVPAHTTVAQVCRSLGFDVEDNRAAPTLTQEDVDSVLLCLRAQTKPVEPEALGFIGKKWQPDWPGYARKVGASFTQAGAHIPFVVEGWAICSRAPQKGQGDVDITVIINRSATVATIHATSWPGVIALRGCGLDRHVKGPATGNYVVILSVITPYLQLATDGKEPSLAPFAGNIAEVLRKVCGAAHRAIGRPERGTTIRDAAWSVMDEAYQIASGGGCYPANARQIMYAARPAILELTGQNSLNDAYFTQTLLPDYIYKFGKEAAWDVVFDSRGSLIEPHTRNEVRLGTIDVRNYLGRGADFSTPVQLRNSDCYPTQGPEHRFTSILFIEKEGFWPLLEAAKIGSRYDIAIMSTKGMSSTASRHLLDGLAPQLKHIFVLHDFDVSGFSIFGTLCSDGRRYTFENEIQVIDIGLRLADVKAMDLQSEPVATSGCWESRAATLRQHGATGEEIEFLKTRRVELNAMPADVFIGSVERTLMEYGVYKVVPEQAIIVAHARRVIEQRLAQTLLSENKRRLESDAAATLLPDNLREQVASILKNYPEVPWDQALASIV